MKLRNLLKALKGRLPDIQESPQALQIEEIEPMAKGIRRGETTRSSQPDGFRHTHDSGERDDSLAAAF